MSSVWNNDRIRIAPSPLEGGMSPGGGMNPSRRIFHAGGRTVPPPPSDRRFDRLCVPSVLSRYQKTKKGTETKNRIFHFVEFYVEGTLKDKKKKNGGH